jgi:molybdate transport system permease protein
MDWSPFWISLRVAGWATLFSVLIGMPIAFGLARRPFPGRDMTIGLINLPLVLPPTVLGYALLVGLGEKSPLSHEWQLLTGHPLGLVFTWQGAVAAACVASIPLFISQARVAIGAVDPDVIDAARSDGAGRTALLWHVFIPLALPGLLAGSALAFARALGDFGATLMVAGDTPGLTRTMSLAIYDAVITGDTQTVGAFILITCLLCVIVTMAAARIAYRR